MGVVSPDQKGPQKETTDDFDELKLRSVLASALKVGIGKQEQDPYTRFHEQFRKEADEYDRDFHKKYQDDLNAALVFAGLFSAVASAFIVLIQPQLQPDYEQLNFTVLTMLLNATPGVPNQTAVPTWSGPDPSVVQAQSMMFASLAGALLAAFLAMLGKQWMNLHVEGSFIDRNRHRELRMRGIITWKFKFVMECLPLIMQLSLLLLGCALARYFWNLSRTVSSVITAFTTSGFIFYLLIVFAATFSKACPFQTPVSVVLRLIIRCCRSKVAEVYKTARQSSGSNQPHGGPTTPRNQTTPPPIPDEQDGQVRADSNCITTMFKMTKASESVIAIMAYIPEINWDKRIKSIPLIQVYQALRESLWRSADGKPLLRPGAKERALGSARALLHLYIQRRCVYGPDENYRNQVQSIDHPKQPLGYSDFDGGSDLKSTFYIIDWAFDVKPQPQIPWSEFKLSKPHHCWLGHLLQYRAWEFLRNKERLSGDVRGFLDYSLKCATLPDRVVANCLFIINMMAGNVPADHEALYLEDRRPLIVPLIDEIFDTLEATFKQNTPSGDITPAEEVLSLVVQLKLEQVQIKSYALFKGIMDLVRNDVRLWEPARLLMKGVYSSTEWVPPTGDPEKILDFLHHYISQRATVGDEPIYYAFRSIIIRPNAGKRHALEAYGLSNPSFIDAIVDVIIQVLQNKDNMTLKRASLLILPELDSILFKSEVTFGGDKASNFVKAWSTAISELLHEPTDSNIEAAGAKILLAIADLPCLRGHLSQEQWGLVYKFPTALYSHSPSMERCIRNPHILPFIKQSAGIAGKLGWLGMLWLKYHSLSDEVRKQLEAETREIGSSPRHFELDSYVNLFDHELKRLQAIIQKLEPLNQSVPGRRAELDAMGRAKGRLVEIQKEEKERKARVSRSNVRQASQRPNTFLGIPIP